MFTKRLIHLLCGDSQSTAGTSRATSARSSAPQSSFSPLPTPKTSGKQKVSTGTDQDESPPVRKQKLQEEHKRNQFVEENLITVFKDSSGPAGNTYQCKRCKRVWKGSEASRIRAIAHADKCGKAKGRTCKKRGKNQRKFPCTLCGHKEATKKAMMLHRQNAHQIRVRTQCSASQCMRYFSSVKSLRCSSFSS